MEMHHICLLASKVFMCIHKSLKVVVHRKYNMALITETDKGCILLYSHVWLISLDKYGIALFAYLEVLENGTLTIFLVHIPLDLL